MNKEFCISEICRFFKENNKLPTTKDFYKKNGYISHTTVMKYCGRWNLAIEEACSILNIKNTNTRSNTMTDEELKIYIKDNCNIDNTGCWVWQGLSQKGYGRISYKNKSISVHRLIFILFKDTNLQGNLEISHKCNNSLCCNPDHLEQVSHSLNMQYRKDYTIKRIRAESRPSNLPKEEYLAWYKSKSIITNNSCYLYPFTDKEGYVQIQIDKKSVRLHRWIYCFYSDKDYNDKSFVVRHLCHNKNCFNPNHLEHGSNSDNVLDSRHYSKTVKLNEDQVHLLLQDAKKQDFTVFGSKIKFAREWAKKLPIKENSIVNIINGEFWKDIYNIYFK